MSLTKEEIASKRRELKEKIKKIIPEFYELYDKNHPLEPYWDEKQHYKDMLEKTLTEILLNDNEFLNIKHKNEKENLLKELSPKLDKNRIGMIIVRIDSLKQRGKTMLEDEREFM